jgi:hypothetical protein
VAAPPRARKSAPPATPAPSATPLSAAAPSAAPPSAAPPAAGAALAGATGGLLAASPAGIVGWAWHPAQPDRMVDVVVQAGGHEFGRARADDFAIGLVRRRVGGGVPGFILKPPAIPPGPYPLALTLWSEAGEKLGEPLLIDAAERLDARQAPGPAAAVEGVLDGLNAGRLTGWVWNSAAPETALGVELHDGDQCLARALAAEYRPDLELAGKRGGACAFSLDVPATILDGAVHRLHVRVAGHGIELPNSPVTLGPLQLGALTDEIAALRAELARLASRVEAAVAPDGRFQSELIRHIAERVAALGEIQTNLVVREMEALRALHRAMPQAAPPPPALIADVAEAA